MHRPPPLQLSNPNPNPNPYAPHRPSLLSSSPSHSHSPQHPSSDTPSSPTTSSFYRGGVAPSSSSGSGSTVRPAGRAYKSRASSRRSLALPSSSSPSAAAASTSTSTSTSARLFALSASHAARVRSLASTRQSFPSSSAAAGVADEPGGWTPSGEWEEFTPEEQAQLEVEMMRARREFKWEWRRREEEAEERGFLDVDFDVDEEERGEEGADDGMDGDEDQPPLDLLYLDHDPSLFLPSPSLFPPRLPSLTSDAGSGPPSSAASSSVAGGDSDMDDLDATGVDEAEEAEAAFESQDSLTSNSHRPSSLMVEPSDASLRAFDAALLGAACPACSANASSSSSSFAPSPGRRRGRTVQPDGGGGATCAPSAAEASAGEVREAEGGAAGQEAEEGAGCGWSIPPEVMHPLRLAFAAHASSGSDPHPQQQAHLPLLHHTPFTGTLVLCSSPGCGDQFAA
ncbi:hypothetical protein JCM6882_000547 [Rhodosporidiobolus microsporus]